VDGATGITGATGVQGATGVDGATGPAGPGGLGANNIFAQIQSPSFSFTSAGALFQFIGNGVGPGANSNGHQTLTTGVLGDTYSFQITGFASDMPAGAIGINVRLNGVGGGFVFPSCTDLHYWYMTILFTLCNPPTNPNHITIEYSLDGSSPLITHVSTYTSYLGSAVDLNITLNVINSGSYSFGTLSAVLNKLL
jgi:hypothetical protein